MSYEPTNWKSGDVVTSQKLNKIEAGIASAGCVTLAHVDITQDGNTVTYALDKTYTEIETAIESGPVFSGVYDPMIGYYVWSITYAKGYDEETGKYIVNLKEAELDLEADTESDYPTFTFTYAPGPTGPN